MKNLYCPVIEIIYLALIIFNYVNKNLYGILASGFIAIIILLYEIFEQNNKNK